MSSDLLVGIFVGGRARRMGGIPKGMLHAPHSTQTLVERLINVVHDALPTAALVLVGQHDAYARAGLEQIADAAGFAGPRAGLLALCQTALARERRRVIALACDLPYLEAPLLRTLAAYAPDSAALAPLIDDRFQPFFACYAALVTQECIQRNSRKRSAGLIALLKELDAGELPLGAEEASQLKDWDTPTDIQS